MKCVRALVGGVRAGDLLYLRLDSVVDVVVEGGDDDGCDEQNREFHGLNPMDLAGDRHIIADSLIFSVF